MSGVKGKSGPPGHLHNAKHPWRSFWKRRALKPQHRWVLPVIEDYATSLASEKGDLTQAEHRVIEVAQISRGCAMLILAECAAQGLIVKNTAGHWDLAPGAKELSRYLSTELKALALLGLDRRSKAATSLPEFLETFGREAPDEAT